MIIENKFLIKGNYLPTLDSWTFIVFEASAQPTILCATARLVLQLPPRASGSDIMRRQLRWLEMCASMCWCLHRLAPHCLSDHCMPAMVNAHLRSSVTFEWLLSILRTKTKTIGLRRFYFASSAAWNALPVQLRDPELSLNSFKIKFKTHSFSWYLPTWVIMLILFVVRANAIIYKLAPANVCIELNWATKPDKQIINQHLIHQHMHRYTRKECDAWTKKIMTCLGQLLFLHKSAQLRFFIIYF